MGLSLGARLRGRVIKVGSASFDAGNTSSVKLPQGSLLKRLWFRLSGSLNITTALTLKSLAPAGLVKKFEIVGDGKTIWAADPRDLYEIARFLTSKAGEIVTSTATGAAQPIAIAFPVDFQAFRRANPADSNFWSEPYGQLEAKITWASAAADIFSAGAATVNSSTKVDLTLEDTYVGHDQVQLIRTITFVEKTVAAATTAFELPLPRNGLMDCSLIRADIDGVYSDAIINAVTMQFDGSFEPIKNVTWPDLQNKCVSDMSVDGGAAGTGRITGVALVDLIENGMLTSAPNLKAMNDPKFVMDVNKPAGTTLTIRATVVGYEPAIGAAA